MGRHWTEKEDEYILKNYKNKSPAEISNAIGRSYSSIRNRVFVLKKNHGKVSYGKRKYHKKFTGCDEDCFNCKYNDCIKPDKLIRG
jgi:hypothetical protein